MQKFKQLNLSQRYQIQVLLRAGYSQIEISTILEVHKSTISRELTRNIASRGQKAGAYIADNALRKTSLRHTLKTKHIKFTEELKQEIVPLSFKDKWSQELISASRKKEGKTTISHETILQMDHAYQKE